MIARTNAQVIARAWTTSSVQICVLVAIVIVGWKAIYLTNWQTRIVIKVMMKKTHMLIYEFLYISLKKNLVDYFICIVKKFVFELT